MSTRNQIDKADWFFCEVGGMYGVDALVWDWYLNDDHRLFPDTAFPEHIDSRIIAILGHKDRLVP